MNKAVETVFKFPLYIPVKSRVKLTRLLTPYGIKSINPDGKWTGYGFEQLPKVYVINNLEQLDIYNIKEKEYNDKKITRSKPIIDLRGGWARRLDRLTGIGLDDAFNIADELLARRMEYIFLLEDSQRDCPTYERGKLLRKLLKSNALRHLKDSEEAFQFVKEHKKN